MAAGINGSHHVFVKLEAAMLLSLSTKARSRGQAAPALRPEELIGLASVVSPNPSWAAYWKCWQT
jgi:hypothetical protein